MRQYWLLWSRLNQRKDANVSYSKKNPFHPSRTLVKSLKRFAHSSKRQGIRRALSTTTEATIYVEVDVLSLTFCVKFFNLLNNFLVSSFFCS